MKLIALSVLLAASLGAQTQGELISQDQFTTGAAAQATLGNNILLGTAGAQSLDTMVSGQSQYRSVHIQLAASAGISAGQVIFEHSLNNVTFFPLQMYELTSNTTIAPATSFNIAFTVAANTNRMFAGKLLGRYIRCRISTGFVGGTVQAFSRLSIADYVPVVTSMSTASINTVIASGTVTVSQAALYAAAVTDIASAAITTTVTSAAVALTNVQGAAFSVNVTGAAGTDQTLDVSVECSLNTTTWFPIYQFERITVAGTLHSPTLALPCQQVRYVRTITGISPSFTMSVTRVAGSVEGIAAYQYFDRTISATTLNATTPAFFVQGATMISAYVSSAEATSAADVVLETSADKTNWVSLQSPLTTVANTTSLMTAALAAKWVRVRIATAGTGQTFNYVAIATGR